MGYNAPEHFKSTEITESTLRNLHEGFSVLTELSRSLTKPDLSLNLLGVLP